MNALSTSTRAARTAERTPTSTRAPTSTWAAVGLAVGAAALGTANLDASSPDLRLALAAAVALLGMPHGALDFSLARLVGARTDLRRAGGFLIAYMALAALVLAAWWLAPLPTLLAFLSLSIVHFGLADVPSRGSPRASEVALRGAIPIFVPVAAHPAVTGELFALLAGTSTEGTVASLERLGPWLVATLVALAVLVVLRELRSPTPTLSRALVEPAALGAIFVLTPPLIAFTLYFCGWHSARHVLAARRWLTAEGPARPTAVFVEALAIWVLALGLVAALALWAAAGGEFALDNAALRALFMGLAALTLPHAVLVDGRVRPLVEPRPTGR